jgi:hypothetical protein
MSPIARGMRTQDPAAVSPFQTGPEPCRLRLVRGGLAVIRTSVPPSQGGNELKGVVVSDYANYAPCPVTPRLMQEIEEQNSYKTS